MWGLVILIGSSLSWAQTSAGFVIGEQNTVFGQSRAEVEAAYPSFTEQAGAHDPEGIVSYCSEDGATCLKLHDGTLVAAQVRCANPGCPDTLDLWGEVLTKAMRTMEQKSKGRVAYGKSQVWGLGTVYAEFAEINIANSGLPPIYEATIADLALAGGVVTAHPGYLADLRVEYRGEGGVEKRPKSDPHPPEIRGPISPATLDATMAAHAEVVEGCYTARAEKNPDLAGASPVKFHVNGDGSVGDVTGVAGTLDDKKVSKCLVKVVKGLRLVPLRAGDQALVTYPFVFGL